MEDLYEILGCSATASTEEIKSCVRQARLRYHPDRSEQQSANSERFLAIQKAWSVLKSPELRQRYDSVRAQQRLMANSAGAPIQTELNLDEFTFESNSTDPESMDCLVDGVYWVPCRCGGTYVLDSVGACCKVSFVPCTDCSLVVRVIYPEKQ